MIVEIATIMVTEGKEQSFIDAFARAQKYLSASPHCLRYQLTRGIEQTSRFILRIEWDSVAGHMEKFRGSPEYQEFRDLLYPNYAAPPEILHYDEILLPAPTGSC